MSNLFAKVEQEAFRAGITPRTKQSRDWFRSKLASMGKVSRSSLMRDEQLKLVNKSQPLIGSMNMFFYDPKHKDTLPYYDRFPLSVIVGPAAGGFYGLNLHYLQPTLRARMLDALMDVTNNNKYDDSTRFEISYKLLTATSKLKFFKPCYKHYLFAHVKSRLARVSAPEWEIATFLPTADFEGSKSKVYSDSRSMI
tara:strand:+ start:336 stop:923 length:588 start_codon:yes stop_codon:yes gene_type:complete